MKAVVIEGGALHLRELPDPEPGPDEVRVDVRATALNRADIYQRMGKYPQPGPPPEHEIPGLEFAGTVDGTGERVCGLLAGGGYASKVVTHRRMLIPIPENLSFEEAAAVPEVFFTAWDALEDKGRFTAGDVVLIHAAGSGVGTAAIQLAKTLGAKEVIGTTRTRSKAERCLELGADRIVVPPDESFEDVGADVILDFVGAAYMESNLKAAALEGRIVLIASLGGSKAEVSMRAMLGKRLTLRGTTLRSRPLEQKILLTKGFVKHILPHFTAGRMKPVIDRVVPLAEAAEAHAYMESNASFGKIVLKV